MPALPPALPLRVLMVSTSYPADLRDWRGLFIRHLADALARRPDLSLRLWAPPGERAPAVQDATNGGDRRWLEHLMQAGGIAHLQRQGGLRGRIAPLALLLRLRALYRRERTVALWHVNWLQNALPLPRDGRPLLATVLGTDFKLLSVPGMTLAVRRALRGRRAVLCPNAPWMVPALERRFGDLAQVRCVPFGIDPEWFELRNAPDRAAPARWVCVTRLTAAKLGTLFDWGACAFSEGGRELHLFGPMQEPIELPAWVRHHGPASPAQLRERVFPGAAGLISLSRHDEGRPQVMLEAMAAGLPIVASDLPAHADLLGRGIRGALVRDAAGLVPVLEQLEQDVPARRLAAAARDWVRREVGTWDDCAARFVALYRELQEAA